MWVMTFHAACARMLRAEAARLGYTRQFTIYDQADARRLVKRCLDELGVDPKRFTPGAVHHQISDAKNKLRDAEAYAQLVGSYFEQTVADVYELYERELHRMNAMDFDDLLVNAVNVLELFPEVRDRYRRAFRHVLVDEYQDTNARPVPPGCSCSPASTATSRSWATMSSRSTASAARTSRNILSFEDDFPDAHVVELEQNYRSTQTILERRERGHRAQPRAEAQVAVDRLGDGDQIRDPRARRRARRGALRRRRDRAARRRGRSPAEIAVFYRMNAQSRVIEDTLVRRDIAYQVIGGTKFYERAEIKDAIAYLTVLGNPQDVVSFKRIVNSPRRGIGQTSLSHVIAHAHTMGIASGRPPRRREPCRASATPPCARSGASCRR